MSECIHTLRRKQRFYHHGPEAGRPVVESILLCGECRDGALAHRIPLWESCPSRREVAAMRQRLLELDADAWAPGPSAPSEPAVQRDEEEAAPPVTQAPPTEGRGRPGRNTPDRICEVPGCDKPLKARRRCSRCHQRARIGGWLDAHPEGDKERWAARLARREAEAAAAAELRCMVPGCDEGHKARGRCDLHYQRALRMAWVELDPAGDLERWEEHEAARRVAPETCQVPGCDTPHRAWDRCDKHYKRAEAGGWLSEDPEGDEQRWRTARAARRAANQTLCQVDLCQRRHSARGRCQMHWRRAHRHGWLDLDPCGDRQRWEDLHPATDAPSGCEVPGCEREHKARGRCSLHYSRARTLHRLDGDPAGDVEAWGAHLEQKAQGLLSQQAEQTGQMPARMLWAVTEPAVAPFDADSLVAIVDASDADSALEAARSDLGLELDGAEAHVASSHDLAVLLEAEREAAGQDVDEVRAELRRARRRLVAAEVLLAMQTMRFPACSLAEVYDLKAVLLQMKRSGRLPAVVQRPADDLVTERGAAK